MYAMVIKVVTPAMISVRTVEPDSSILKNRLSAFLILGLMQHCRGGRTFIAGTEISRQGKSLGAARGKKNPKG
jgi:hypothetical protein